MSSKSVEILIEADNQASKELKAVRMQIEQQVGGIQKAGQQAKASTELVGTFAAAFGGNEIAGFAGQIAQMTDRIREFGEVGKQGRLTAIAFKGALVGAVAIGAFKAGQAIGNLIFQTDRWSRKAEEAMQLSAELGSKLVESNREIFADERAEIDLIRDPQEKKAQITELLDLAKRNLSGVHSSIRRTRNELEAMNDEWYTSENDEALIQAAKQRLDQQSQLRDMLEQQTKELEKQVSPIQKQFEERKRIFDLQNSSDDFLQTLRDELELLRASKDEAIAIMAARNTYGDEAQSEAERLMRERDAILAKAEAEREAAQAAEQAERKKQQAVEQAERKRQQATEQAERKRQQAAEQAAQARIAAAERVANAEMGALQNLQKQVIELTRGKQAGREFALQLQGIDKETAKRIATAESKLARLQELQNDAGGDAVGQIAAVQSRLLSRGSGNDLAERDKEAERLRVQQETKKATEDVRDAVKDLQAVIENNQSDAGDSLTVKVVK